MSEVEVSAREAEVLAAITRHRSNAQIARALHISVRTVESHVSSLLRKYSVTDRRELADLAVVRSSPGMTGLPAGRTSFVGRVAETAAVTGALQQARLVTLLGPGGMGKTRLAALAAADAGVSGAFVDLVPVRDGLVTRAVAAALEVIERPPQPLEQALVERLRVGRTLLVLDNCEHVVEEVGALVERLLAAGPDTTVLATSRERLGVVGEHTVLVPPLPLESDAAELFADRARAVDPLFRADPADVADLCGRLDGMPLAIELAAARTGSLGLEGLRAALDDRLRLLAGGRGADPRHRSLSAVIGWSYDLLDDDERLLFRRLGVYVGEFDLDAAGATSPERPRGEVADLLGRLTDRSLVVRRGARWRLLDTIRAYALQLLGSDELTAARERYLGWALTTAAELETRLATDVDESALREAYGEVVSDLRAALASTAPTPGPMAHRLARSLGHLAFAHRAFTESIEHYTCAADRAEDGVAAARDLRAAADAALAVADGQTTVRLLLDAGDRAAIDGNVRASMLASAVIAINRYPCGPLFELPPEETERLMADAEGGFVPGDPHVAALLATARAWEHGGRRSGVDERLAGEAVDAARLSGDPVLLAGALDALQTAVGNAGRLREARGHAAERMRLIEPLPWHEPYAAAEITDAYHVASTTAVAVGDLPGALAVAQAVVTGDPVADHPYISLPRLIRLYALSGRFDECLTEADALWERWQRDGSPPMEWMSSALSAGALVHGLRGDGSFAQWQERALAIARTDDPATSPPLAAPYAFVEARVAAYTRRAAAAADLVERAFADFEEQWWAPYARAAGAELAVVAGLPNAAERLVAAEAAAAENDWAVACLARARARLSGDAGALAAAIEGFARIDARFEHACTLLLTDDSAAAVAELRALGVPVSAEGAQL